MRFFRYIVILFFLHIAITQAGGRNAVLPRFTVYAYIPWQHKNNCSEHAHSESPDCFEAFGMKPIRIFYENKYFKNGAIDLNKIKKIALEAARFPRVPISFDMEFGNRFKPETIIPRVKTILHAFRRYNSVSLIGLYALIPQNTYGLKMKTLSYKRHNSQYDSLVNEVDFISPSLYNYQGHDFNHWLINARFTMNQAKQYKQAKPIIPYISPIVRLGASNKAKNGNLVEVLSEEEMSQRLHALQRLGASGCILWASSQDRTKDGEFPQFDPARGWGKAVVEFIHSKG